MLDRLRDGMRDGEGHVSPRRMLPWVGLAVVALGVLVGYLGVIPGVWGQTALLVLFLGSVLALRHDLVSATVLVALAIVEDWFQLVPLPHDVFYVALVGGMALLLVLFVSERRERPWREVRRLDLGFWGLFLLLGLLAVPRSINIPGNPKTIFFIALNYWIYIFLTACVFWLLGAMLVRRGADVRRLCVYLSALVTVLAVHAIIQEVTGIVPLATPYWIHYLALPSINDYRLPGGPARATSFFMAPDTAEAFFSSVVFLPLGLLVASRTWAERALYVGQIVLIILALLFTFGPVGWVAVVIGVVLFAAFALQGRARLRFVGGLAAAAVVGGVVLAREWHLVVQHATGASEIRIRLGLFLTALHAIEAKPLTGIGLGQGWVYMLRAAPYKDPIQPHVYADAQNSFQEFAALAGIPVLIAFLLVLGRALIGAVRNIARVETTLRPVFLGALLVVVGICINGLSDVTFTTPPLVPLAFLLLGALSSPRLARSMDATNATNATGTDHDGEQVGRSAPYPVRYGPPVAPMAYEALPEQGERPGHAAHAQAPAQGPRVAEDRPAGGS